MEAYAYRELEAKKPAAGGRRRAHGAVAALTLTAAPTVVSAKKGAKAPAAPPVPTPDLGTVLKKASASAFRGGVAGFAAGVVQVCSGYPSARARLSSCNATARWALSCGCALS
jgi:hypothetical protein